MNASKHVKNRPLLIFCIPPVQITVVNICNTLYTFLRNKTVNHFWKERHMFCSAACCSQLWNSFVSFRCENLYLL